MFTSDAGMERVTRGMMECTLPKTEWTHAAHFAAALWLLRDRPHRVRAEMPEMIRAYNESVGGRNTETEGYHETITQASLGAAAARLAAHSPGTPLHVVLADLLDSELGRSDWLFAYWSKPVLFSVEARCAWVEPDLHPLPF